MKDLSSKNSTAPAETDVRTYMYVTHLFLAPNLELAGHGCEAPV